MNLQGNIAVQNASKAHKLKVKVRKICQQMDELKTSKVKIDVFFSVLKITNIKLNKDVENELIEKYSIQGMIDYKEALARISINLEEDKPLNTNWVLRSAHSSMIRSSVCTSQYSRIGSSKSPDLIAKLRAESNNKNINNELDQIKVNKQISSNDLNGIIPYPKDVIKNEKAKTPMSSKLLIQKGRVTPGQIDSAKLINQQMKSKHETKFNIITNKDKNIQGSEKDIEDSDKIISTTMSDYQDLSKFIKKKTPSLISINWRYYDNERKQNEIEELIKEVSSDEIKCAKLIDEFSTLKLLINEKEHKSEIELIDTLIKYLSIPNDKNSISKNINN